MGKKFCLSTKSPAPAVQAPAFDALESYAAVLDSFNGLNDAMESLTAVEAEAIELDTIRDTAREAMELFQACGVTADTLGIYNRNGKLDMELGLESLDITTATAEALEARKTEYVTKLGESVASCEGAVIEWFKKFLAAIMDFFKKFFHMDASIIKTLEGLRANIEKPSNPDAEMKGLNKKNLDVMVKALQGIDAVCKDLETKLKDDGSADPDEVEQLISKKVNPSITAMGLTWAEGKITGELKEEFKESKGTIKDKGYAGGAKAALDTVKKYLDSSNMKALSKKLVAITKKISAQEKLEEAAAKTKDTVLKVNAFIKLHAKLSRTVSITLLSLGRAGGGAAASKKEEPAGAGAGMDDDDKR